MWVAVNLSACKKGLAVGLCCCKWEKPPEYADTGRITAGASSIIASTAAGRYAGLREGGRDFGSVVAVGAAETVSALHAGVRGCVKAFSLVRRVRVKNDWNELSLCCLYSASLSSRCFSCFSSVAISGLFGAPPHMTLLWENKHTFLRFSPTQKIHHFLTHAHALSESSCTTVQKNT